MMNAAILSKRYNVVSVDQNSKGTYGMFMRNPWLKGVSEFQSGCPAVNAISKWIKSEAVSALGNKVSKLIVTEISFSIMGVNIRIAEETVKWNV